jgi:surfeit locus 1 family protein
MMSLTRFHIAFTPSFRMTLLALLSFCLFISLGMWQLKRADEKKRLLAQSEIAQKSAAYAWHPQDKYPTQYQRIQLKGHFSKKLILLDNQHEQHQFGYHVFSPLVLTNGKIIIIDRGWVSKEQSNQLETPLFPLTIEGSAYYPSEKQWVLGEPIEIKTPNLAIIETIDIKLMSQFLHKSVYPFIIRQNTHSPFGYVRNWVTVNMPPRRHVAYAFQWLAIAGVILILFIALNIKYEIKKT